ncbi:MAG: Rrf2 family transcriptional regulator [Mariprofundales bacterium]
MRLSNRAQYAVSAMVDLMNNQKAGPVTLSSISERQHISLSYLEQMFRCLREGGLVRSVRGPGGGYLVGKEAGHISIADIVTAVDHNPYDQEQVQSKHNIQPNGQYARPISTKDLWTQLDVRVMSYLSDVSLSSLSLPRFSTRVSLLR